MGDHDEGILSNEKEDVLRNLGASECGWTSAEAEQRLVQTDQMH